MGFTDTLMRVQFCFCVMQVAAIRTATTASNTVFWLFLRNLAFPLWWPITPLTRPTGSPERWNPIEHRLFCHVHRAMSGVVFTDYATIKERIESTTTSTGLRVVVRLNLGLYEKGIKVDPSISQHARIRYHPTQPTLNYKISPD